MTPIAAKGSEHGSGRGKMRIRQADKRLATLVGATVVFARDGYSRASIDAIAAEAGVSSRTIYNHFQDKAQLFQIVIQESTARVAEAQVAIIDRHLHKVTDLEPDLISCGLALATPMTEYADHFALIRQVNAEVGHIPQAAIDAWQEAGPRRVRRELARHLQQLANRGLLRIAEADRAATHYLLLIQGAIPFHHGIGVTREAEISEIVTSGVRAFLHGYLPDAAMR